MGRGAGCSIADGAVRMIVLAVAVWGTACALYDAKETRYLKTVHDRATQEEIRRELGRPAMIAATPEGSAVWVYEVRQLEPGSQSTWSAFGSWCDEYVLTFDKQGVLRHWTHRSEAHGGETSPSFCVTNGFKAGPPR